MAFKERKKKGKKRKIPKPQTQAPAIYPVRHIHPPTHQTTTVRKEMKPPWSRSIPRMRCPRVLQQVRKMAVHRVQEGLAGFLALDPDDLEEPVQFVLGLGDLFNRPQLLGIQDVQHVIKDGLQVTGVQADLPQHCVFLFCRGRGGGRERRMRGAAAAGACNSETLKASLQRG